MSTRTSSDNTVYTGRVKWFNSKKGYGFITDINDSNSTDYFVFHNDIQVANASQFRYLVVGEYVEFELIPANNPTDTHNWQAGNVRGIGQGLLMCDTRYIEATARAEYAKAKKTSSKKTSSKKNDEDTGSEYSGSGSGSETGSEAGSDNDSEYVPEPEPKKSSRRRSAPVPAPTTAKREKAVKGLERRSSSRR